MDDRQVQEQGELALLDEITLGSARGGRRVARQCEVQVVRSLTAEDLPALTNPEPLGSEPRTVLALRHSHHQLARLVAQGLEDAEISLITGYSPSYICILKDDPAVGELIEYYSVQREQVFVDTLERMKVLGLNSLEELQRRLESEPDKWAKRELMELVELMLVKGRSSPGGQGQGQVAGGNGQGVNINVKFVTSPEASPVIDVTPDRENGQN